VSEIGRASGIQKKKGSHNLETEDSFRGRDNREKVGEKAALQHTKNTTGRKAHPVF